MKFASSFFYASRFIFPKKKLDGSISGAKKSLIGAMFCIGISLIPLVTVLVISNGMVEGMTERMIGLSTSHLQVVMHNGSVADENEFMEATNLIASTKGVVSVLPELQGIGLAAGNDGRTGATIRAVENNIFESNDDYKNLFSVLEGNPVLETDNCAILGQKIASTLDLHAGDTVRLITTKQLSSGKIVPKIQSFTVSAIVSSGYQELDALWVFIPLKTGFKMFDLSFVKMCVGVKTEDAFGSSLTETALRIKKNIPMNSGVSSWDKINASQYENFASTKLLLMVIMLLIVLVASVNISSALIMLVMERKKEIAILKSLGGSAGGISLAFLIVGVLCGLGGVLIGLPIGLLCAVNCNYIINLAEKALNFFSKFVYLLKGVDSYSTIRLLDPAYYLQNIPISIPLRELFLISAGTLVLSLFASSFPAVKAGQEKPIDTLRKI